MSTTGYGGVFRWTWREEALPAFMFDRVAFGADSAAELFLHAMDALYDCGPEAWPRGVVLELSVSFAWPGIGPVTLWEGPPADMTPEWLDANAGRLWAEAEAAAREADPALESQRAMEAAVQSMTDPEAWDLPF